jgi:hypothetical protein
LNPTLARQLVAAHGVVDRRLIERTRGAHNSLAPAIDGSKNLIDIEGPRFLWHADTAVNYE